MRKILFVIALLFNVIGFAQSVGIGEKQFNPHVAAILEVQSTTKGVLIPRMTCNERNVIPVDNGSIGLLVYQVDSMAGFYYYDGEKWLCLSNKEKISISSEVNMSIEYDSIRNKPFMFSGNYDSLSNKPILFSGNYDSLRNKPLLFSGNYDSLRNKPVMFSGNYIDLNGKPVLSVVATTGVYEDLLDKPVLFSGNYDSLINKPSLFSGEYDSLKHKPVLFNGEYSSLKNKPVLFSGNYVDLQGKPALFDGNYNSLTNKPTLFDGNYDNLINKPSLFNGNYNNLSNKPVMERGNWTPVVPNAALTIYNARYVKTGNLIHASAYFSIKSFSSGTAEFEIKNFPELSRLAEELIPGRAVLVNSQGIPISAVAIVSSNSMYFLLNTGDYPRLNGVQWAFIAVEYEIN